MPPANQAAPPHRPSTPWAGILSLLLPALAVAFALAVTYASRGQSSGVAHPAGEEVSPAPDHHGRVTERCRLAGEVAAGRLGLLEASGRSLALSDASAGFPWAEFRARYPAPTDEESHCRNMIDHASAGDPALRARLEAELARHLLRGRLKLPAPPRP
jgi:hypothetical protein